MMPRPKKREKDREKDKSYDFVFILYLDNPDLDLLLLEIKSYKYDALAILHDKDKYTKDKFDEETGDLIHKEGDYKKPHYHVYMRFSNRRYISGLSKEIGVEEHLIQFCDKGFKNYAEYMLHWGKHGGPGKYTYETDDFVGTLKGSAIQKLSNEPSDLKFYKIVRFIRSYNGFINVGHVYDWCFENGYQGVYMRYTNQIKDFIYLHNDKYYKSEHKL